LYSSAKDIRFIDSRRMRWVGHTECMGKISNGYKLLFRKPEGMRLVGRCRFRWEDEIKINLRCGLDLSGSG
jgi:hypothetical protein